MKAVALGRAIACIRIERGMKRKHLCARTGISYPFLAEVENGMKSPSLARLDLIAEALWVSTSDLMRRADEILADPRNW